MSEVSTLTTVILTKNQAQQVAPLLEQASLWSDQVVVLDDFSEDIQELKDRAKEHNAEIVQHALQDDFAAHRNAVFPAVRGVWTLFLDADELPQPEFWQELRSLIATEKYDALWIRRRNIFLGRTLRYGEAGEKQLLRAARTKVGVDRWRRAVHEVWDIPQSRQGWLQTYVEHQQPESLLSFVRKLNHYAELEQSVRPRLGTISFLLQFALYPTGKFFWNYILKLGFLDGFPGFALAFLMSYYSSIVRIQQYEKTL